MVTGVGWSVRRSIGGAFWREEEVGRRGDVSALAGGALGFGGAIAWGSRDLTSEVLRKAGKNLSAVRDEHWLEKHPISYA